MGVGLTKTKKASLKLSICSSESCAWSACDRTMRSVKPAGRAQSLAWEGGRACRGLCRGGHHQPWLF